MFLGIRDGNQTCDPLRETRRSRKESKRRCRISEHMKDSGRQSGHVFPRVSAQMLGGEDVQGCTALLAVVLAAQLVAVKS
jgi:hypothetical protein